MGFGIPDSRACLTVRFPEVRNRKQTEGGLIMLGKLKCGWIGVSLSFIVVVLNISLCFPSRKLAVFATLGTPGFRFNCFSGGNGWPADWRMSCWRLPATAEIHHRCLNYHRICQNICHIHQLGDRSHSANRHRVLGVR